MHPGSRVLDVGSGSGYLSAVLFQLLQDPSDPRSAGSKVVGIEHIPELVEWSVQNLRKDGLGKELEEGRIKIIAGDGRKGARPNKGTTYSLSVLMHRRGRRVA